MFADILRGLLAPAPKRLPEPDAQLALAALLVRVAKSDGLYAAEEVERIDKILMARHALSPLRRWICGCAPKHLRHKPPIPCALPAR